MPTDDSRLTDMEIQLTHQTKTIDELSDVVAQQGREIARLERKVALLLERAAEEEAGAGGVVLADQKPPHW